MDHAASTDAAGGDGGPLLRAHGLTRRFGATLALDGVDLDVAAGEILAVVGENGAGKSTLMRILAGAESADAGTLHLDGRPYAPRQPLDARRAGVAMIHQELALAPHLTVAENILLGAEPRRAGLLRRGALRARAVAALAPLGHADLPTDRRAADLTPAQGQIVEIARALAVGCRVLILDEPTSSLTTDDTRRLFELLRRLRAQGRAILYISHVLEDVCALADRVMVLRDGRHALTAPVAGLSSGALVAAMVGRPLDTFYPRSPRRPGEAVLTVEELAGARLPCAASLTLRRGEIVGLAGLMGAGRTEFLRAVFGLDPVRAGRVRVGALEGRGAGPARRWAQGVGYVSEDRKGEGLALRMGIADNIALTRLRGFGPPGIVRPAHVRAAAARWRDRLAIRCHAPDQPVGELSGGNQQKVAVARLLQHGADLWLLDEPTRGIDVGAKAALYRLLDELAAGDPAAGRPPCAILMISSYLPELLGVCDRIAVMCRGRLTAARPVADWNETALMRAAVGEAS